jgi:hypothetical protein
MKAAMPLTDMAAPHLATLVSLRRSEAEERSEAEAE